MFEKDESSNKKKMNGCSLQQLVWQSLNSVYVQENAFSKRFHFNTSRKSMGSSKKQT